jgi:hypothetical protein
MVIPSGREPATDVVRAFRHRDPAASVCFDCRIGRRMAVMRITIFNVLWQDVTPAAVEILGTRLAAFGDDSVALQPGTGEKASLCSIMPTSLRT